MASGMFVFYAAPFMACSLLRERLQEPLCLQCGWEAKELVLSPCLSSIAIEN